MGLGQPELLGILFTLEHLSFQQGKQVVLVGLVIGGGFRSWANLMT